jgi:outer membrane protein W
MKSVNRFSVIVLSFFTLITILLSQAAVAADEGWQLRIAGAWINPDLSFSETDEYGDQVMVDSDSSIGFGIGLERRLTSRVGVELGLLSGSQDISLRVEAATGEQASLSNGLSFRPIYLGLNLHLTPDKPVDLYLGPMIAYASYGDLNFVLTPDQRLDVSIDSDWAWGLNLGADIGLGDGPWSLGVAVKYLETELRATEEDDDGGNESLAYDPIIFSIGVGYRF